MIRQSLPRDCCGLGTTLASVWQKPQPFFFWSCKKFKVVLDFVSESASCKDMVALFTAMKHPNTCLLVQNRKLLLQYFTASRPTVRIGEYLVECLGLEKGIKSVTLQDLSVLV